MFDYFNYFYGAFPEKKLKAPVEDINGNFHGGRVKVVGVSGGVKI